MKNSVCSRLMLFCLLIIGILTIFSGCVEKKSTTQAPITTPTLVTTPTPIATTPTPTTIVTGVVANRNPVIYSLDPSYLRAAPGTTTMITSKIIISAGDPDGDVVNFSWEASQGTITGAGREVTWLAPAKPGYYVIKVSVSDGKGGSSVGSVVNKVESVEITDGTCRSEGSLNIQPRDREGRIGYNYNNKITTKYSENVISDIVDGHLSDIKYGW